MGRDMRDSDTGNDASNFSHPVALHMIAAVLRTGKMIDHASSLLFLGVLLIELREGAVSSLWLIAGIAAASIEKYFAWRVALDAGLFTVLCKFPTETVRFDAALAVQFEAGKIKANRSMESRWRGAKRFLIWQVGLVVCQVVILGASIARLN